MARYAVPYKDKEGFSRLQAFSSDATGDRLKRHILANIGDVKEGDYKIIPFTDSALVEKLAAQAKADNQAKTDAAIAAENAPQPPAAKLPVPPAPKVSTPNP